MSDTSSQKAIEEVKKRKCDAVYGILDALNKRLTIKQKVEEKTNKLMQRMDLDRPILQREKFELIMLEKQIDSNGNFTRGEEDIKVHEIKMAMVDRMKQRNVNNKQ